MTRRAMPRLSRHGRERSILTENDDVDGVFLGVGDDLLSDLAGPPANMNATLFAAKRGTSFFMRRNAVCSKST